MDEKLKEQIRRATAPSEAGQTDFLELLRLVDAHYDRIEATISQSVNTQLLAQARSPVDVVFDSVTEALLSVDADGGIRVCNKVCSRYFRLDKDEIIGASLARLVPGAAGLPVGEFLEPFMSDLDDTHVDFQGGEIEAVRANGEKFFAEINASSLETPDGVVYVISLRDITIRRDAEHALKENEERYRALVEFAPEAIIVFDVDGNKFIDVNDKACQLFNLSRTRLLTIGPEAISPKMQPDGTPSFGIRRGLVDRALRGEHPTFEWMHKDSTGREFPCEVRFSRMPSSNAQLLRVSITNIEDRKRNEMLSFAQNKILEMIASSSPSDQTLRAICRFVERIPAAGSGRRSCSSTQRGHRSASRKLRGCRMVCAWRLISWISALTASPAAVPSTRAGIPSSPTSRSRTHGNRISTKSSRRASARCGPSSWFPAKPGGRLARWTCMRASRASRTPTNWRKLSRMARLAGIAIKRQRDEERLRSSEARYRGLFENVIDGVYIASREGDIIAANPALVEMLGYGSVDEFKAVGRTTMLYVNPIDRERVFARLEAEGFVKNFEYRLRRKDKTEIVVLENARAVYDDDGRIVAHEGTITDITERKRAETRVFEEKERAQITLQSIGDGVITTDSQGCIDYINPVAQDLTGWDVRSARGKAVTEIMTIINEHTRATVDNPVMRCLKDGRVIALAEGSVLITRNGDEVPIQDSAAPIRDRMGNIIGSVMVFHDTSKESRLFRQLSYQASHDALTGLINRREFENRLGESLKALHKDREQAHALLYLDLDQFKVVNDTFGHTAGDELLRQISETVQQQIRSSDVFARLGGDEFGILLERCSERQAMDVAESIRSAVEGYRFAWQEAFAAV